MKTLDPWYVSGLVEGEGCFSISFSFRKRLKIGIETRPSFSLSLNQGDLDLLKKVRHYFQCGAIRFSKSDRTYKYEVRSIREIQKNVIPHLNRFPLHGRKVNDFELFRAICEKIHQNKHLNKKHLEEIIDLAFQMNPSGKRKHSKSNLLRVLGKVKV